MGKTMKNEALYDQSIERLDEINENLSLIQRKNGLTFGTDAYILSAFARACPRGVAADLGCGTGVISLLCASKGKFAKVFGVELQEEFVSLSRRNVALNGLENKVEIVGKSVTELKSVDLGQEVDAVLMNPPYMKAESGKSNDFDEKNIARREVCGTIYDFCAAAGRILKFGGALYVVHRPERLIDLTDAMRKAGIEPKKIVFVHSDVTKEPSLILVEGKKGAASDVIITRPLVIYKSGTREYTDDMERIYSDFTLSHIAER